MIQVVRPPATIAKLVNMTPISLWFIVLITIVTGAYKPTNITWGASHCIIYDITYDQQMGYRGWLMNYWSNYCLSYRQRWLNGLHLADKNLGIG